MQTKINIALIFTCAVLIGFVTHLISCEKKADPTPSVTAKLIANNWIMQTVTVDGVDKTAVYTGLTIKFTESGYTTTNGRVVWSASGTWKFTASNATVIERSDGLPVTVEVTDTTLKLSLVWAKTTLGGGRIESVQGQHVFNFVGQ